ncbi:MAG TPA: LptF/LptG family permease [Thermoanaerobaculia bacterium]|nr:LptF/LptG family permease [Thermoanaerobaculia bacterium]
MREIWPPFLLGFGAYTFILIVRTIYFLADFFVRRSATFGEVAWLAVLSLPWIVVLTLPMAFLLGVLIGVGRLAGDSEIVALRSCGVGSAAIYRPALAAAGVLSVGVFLLYNLVLPDANEVLSRSLARVAATSVVNVVQPRTFREARSGVTLFFDRAAPDGRTLEGVFVKLGEEYEKDLRVIVARRGVLTLDGDRLWLDLFNSALHEYDAGDPSRYRTNRSETQRILIAGDIWAGKVSYEKSLRAQSLSELAATAKRIRRESPENYRLAWVEIHKKLSIPFACLAFAVIGIPLAEGSRRGGKGSAFAISLAIIILYYVLLSSGETWAQQGRLPPGIAIWIPNALLLAGGAIAIVRSGRERARWRWPFKRGHREPERAATAAGSRPRFGGLLRFPGILDRYVLARFLTVLFFAAVSVLLLAVIVDYADHVDKIAKNHPPASVVFGYYRCFLLDIGTQIAPFIALIATLVSLGVLSKNNEDTAFKASGVSLHRLAAPILAAAGVAALLFFALGEYVLPFSVQREARYRNIIYGRPVDYGVARTPAERNWRVAPDGRVWHQEESDPEKGLLISPSVFEFDKNFDLVRRDSAREAFWNGKEWIFRQGWTRTFGSPTETAYQTYLQKGVPGDPPRAFARDRRTPDQMRWRELQQYARRLKASGYPTGNLETALHAKFSMPALVPLMALLAVPFAFRIGRRGTLAGIGVGLALGMGFLIATAFFTKLGDVGALPAPLAAWSPNVLAATGAIYLLLRLRT